MWFMLGCSLCYCDHQVAELQEELTQVREQKGQLEKELDTQTTETQKQVENHELPYDFWGGGDVDSAG